MRIMVLSTLEQGNSIFSHLLVDIWKETCELFLIVAVYEAFRKIGEFFLKFYKRQKGVSLAVAR